jgi:predicted GNAT family acetyltransferase
MSNSSNARENTPLFAVAHEEGPSKGRYSVRLERAVAEMTYTRVGERLIIIDHTSVPESLRGRGLGTVLVHRAVEDARAADKTILPLCPFARAQFDRHPEWCDVLGQRP